MRFPRAKSAHAWIMVKALGNYFFDVNDKAFTHQVTRFRALTLQEGDPRLTLGRPSPGWRRRPRQRGR